MTHFVGRLHSPVPLSSGPLSQGSGYKYRQSLRVWAGGLAVPALLSVPRGEPPLRLMEEHISCEDTKVFSFFFFRAEKRIRSLNRHFHPIRKSQQSGMGQRRILVATPPPKKKAVSCREQHRSYQ